MKFNLILFLIFHLERQLDFTGIGKFGGISQQVKQHLPKSPRISPDKCRHIISNGAQHFHMLTIHPGKNDFKYIKDCYFRVKIKGYNR